MSLASFTPEPARAGADDSFYSDLALKTAGRSEALPESLPLILERIRAVLLSDRVGFIFNVSARMDGGQVVLSGETERPEFASAAREALLKAGYTQVVDRVDCVPAAASAPFAVAVAPKVMTWSRPDLTGIPMDEALYGEPVYIFKELPEVCLVKNFSGYWGYAAKAGVKRIAREAFIELVNAPKALFLGDYGAGTEFVPAGSRLRIKEWGAPECVLLGPLGGELKVPSALCLREDRQAETARVLERARSYLGRPYNLGGRNSATGIDCSALVLMSYRAAGFNLARDAKQQYLNGSLIHPCAAQALAPGDALFFISKSGVVDHTALYLGGRQIIHATGDSVKIQSMDPAAPDYFKRFDSEFLGAKRYWR